MELGEKLRGAAAAEDLYTRLRANAAAAAAVARGGKERMARGALNAPGGQEDTTSLPPSFLPPRARSALIILLLVSPYIRLLPKSLVQDWHSASSQHILLMIISPYHHAS
jgi:hypothetical protein